MTLGISVLSWPPEYQQVYASANFAQTTTFTGIAFRVAAGDPAVSSVNGGTFKISLSTTSAPVFSAFGGTGLNTANLAANLGSNNTIVYNGPLPAVSGGMLTIPFSTSFTYNPSSGNLLLDVQSTDATNSVPFIYLAMATNISAFSRAWAKLDSSNSPMA